MTERRLTTNSSWTGGRCEGVRSVEPMFKTENHSRYSLSNRRSPTKVDCGCHSCKYGYGWDDGYRLYTGRL